MNFPPDWNVPKSSACRGQQASECAGEPEGKQHQHRKRKRRTKEACDDTQGREEEGGEQLECERGVPKNEIHAAPREVLGAEDGILSKIVNKLARDNFAPMTPQDLCLDHVLSHVPYQAMLETMFSGEESVPAVKLVTKAYEEAFMREAGPGERACVMGSECECMHIDKSMPFVCVEFVVDSLDVEQPRDDSSIQNGMCVICCRKTTQRLYHDMLRNKLVVKGLIQKYGNIGGQEGEYASECLLVCPPFAQAWHCMPYPIMSHQRNRYKVINTGGRKRLKQLRVDYVSSEAHSAKHAPDFFGHPSKRPKDK